MRPSVIAAALLAVSSPALALSPRHVAVAPSSGSAATAQPGTAAPASEAPMVYHHSGAQPTPPYRHHAGDTDHVPQP